MNSASSRGGAKPGARSLRRRTRLAALCAGMGLAIAYADFRTGPFFQSSYFFTIPVGIAAWHGGRLMGLAFALLLPASQSAYFLETWRAEFGPAWVHINLALQIPAFSAFAE